MKKRKYSFKAGACRNSLIKPNRNILFDCFSILLLPRRPFIRPFFNFAVAERVV